MEISIGDVMAGIIDFSAYGVFVTATSSGPLTEDEWLTSGLAAVNLVGAATLVTTAGAGPEDARWVSDPDWRKMARDMQAAGIRVGNAIRDRDRSSYLKAANQLATACRSCHDQFRPEAPVRGATQLAQAGQ
jgi:hypothetical protein